MPAALAHAVVPETRPQPGATATAPGPGIAADPLVLPIKGEVRNLTFPEANLDGSFIDSGNEMTFAADVFFESGKAALTSKAGAALDKAAGRLKELNAAVVRVSGHTDSAGSTAYNRRLSQERAQSVRDALRHRVSGLRIEVRGYGESLPVADNGHARGRALNRRVTVTILK
mgnify:CR=1 FL=1